MFNFDNFWTKPKKESSEHSDKYVIGEDVY